MLSASLFRHAVLLNSELIAQEMVKCKRSKIVAWWIADPAATVHHRECNPVQGTQTVSQIPLVFLAPSRA
jgi:hypothetical protein